MKSQPGLGRVAVVADDDPGTLRMLSQLLRKSHFHVIAVADGEAAVAAARDWRPQMVLLDARMPHLDGFDACAQMRALSGMANVPIVMVTGNDDVESVNKAYNAGATDYIAKPINWPLLGHRLRYILRNAGLMQALEKSEAANRTLLSAIPDRILVLDSEGGVRRSLDGGDGTEPMNSPQHLSDLFPGYIAKQALAKIDMVLTDRRSRTHEYAHQRTSASLKYFEARYTHMDEDHVVALIRDVTETKQAERKIHTLANFDPLTGLPNRELFVERCANTIADAGAADEGVATLYIDLDQFGRVNDSLGHASGDELLKSVSARLLQCVRRISNRAGHCDVARFGGDEFVIFLRHLQPEVAAIGLAQDVIGAMSDPFVHGEHDFVVTPSIGIAVWPIHGADAETLLKSAATAVQSAKASGRNTFRLYAEAMSTRTVKRVCMESELRRALKSDEFEVHFQPKYETSSLGIAGAEALMRWFHPQQGAISPGTFIPLAEEAGLIVEVGSWMVRNVCAQVGSWVRQGIPVPPIAVNISGEEFRHGDPVRLLQSACRDAGIDPRLIEVEITESVLLHDVDTVRRSLRQIKDLGFSLAVDDFGVGYSSLAYLQRFPLDTLKIDRAFLQDIRAPDDEAAICSAIIALAHSLNLKVVAEGIETAAQSQCMIGLGVDLLQGFLLSEPLSAPRFRDLLMLRPCSAGEGLQSIRAASSDVSAVAQGPDST